MNTNNSQVICQTAAQAYNLGKAHGRKGKQDTKSVPADFLEDYRRGLKDGKAIA